MLIPQCGLLHAACDGGWLAHTLSALAKGCEFAIQRKDVLIVLRQCVTCTVFEVCAPAVTNKHVTCSREVSDSTYALRDSSSAVCRFKTRGHCALNGGRALSSPQNDTPSGELPGLVEAPGNHSLVICSVFWPLLRSLKRLCK